MTSRKMWNIAQNILSIFPESVKLVYTKGRGLPAVEDQDITEETGTVIRAMILGVIKRNNICMAIGTTTDLLLGKCYTYTLPFGSNNEDTGHTTIIVSLPSIMDGCYHFQAGIKGHIGSKSDKDYYNLTMIMEIYIRLLADSEAKNYIEQGIEVYPARIEHPELYPDASESETELTTDPSDEEVIPARNNKGKEKRLLVKSSLKKQKKTNFKNVVNVLARTRDQMRTLANKAIIPGIDSDAMTPPHNSMDEENIQSTT